jgi:hypothetical protein
MLCVIDISTLNKTYLYLLYCMLNKMCTIHLVSDRRLSLISKENVHNVNLHVQCRTIDLFHLVRTFCNWYVDVNKKGTSQN